MKAFFLLIAIIGLFGSSVSSAGFGQDGLPEFAVGEMIQTDELPIRLKCIEHFEDHRNSQIHTAFEIEFFSNESWKTAGGIVAHFKKNDAIFGRHLHIRRVDVDGEFKGQKIATRAIKLLSAYYQPAKYHLIRASVASSNIASRRLFNSLGFKRVMGSEDVATYVKGNACKVCFAHSKEGEGKLFKCSRCEAAFYCSKEHQVADWKQSQHRCVNPNWDNFWDNCPEFTKTEDKLYLDREKK